jgi:ATP-dependent RNA helicase SUPV3L1/SUV3
MNDLSPSAAALARSRSVTAVLGPTNTGKTHYAIDRMLAYGSGMIGLPLRLLAREVYNRAVARVGAEKVALVTGEEKIKPEGARYWVCTVEAMPRDIEVDFVAVDEVQIAADFERGHVFTDRILHARGLHETLLLGADTMRPILARLLPGAQFVTRPRLSNLAYAGEKKITRLPPRSAAVAFSADEVYAIAELVRRQRGGAAVVLGALSPRTRNAQVELYQNGDVDVLVATDAIGMGLNLDVEHVAFASARKFDGFQFRNLTPAELGQIAGRAGRHLRDGTFGVTARVEPFDAELVRRLETHDFEPVRMLQWRNPRLDFRSLAALRQSLARPASEAGLVRAPAGEDVEVLELAARAPEIAALAASAGDVARLWEAAQIPDYRKVSPASHAELCIDVFRFLQGRGRIPDDWFARHVNQSDRLDGDIDTLSTRIAHMRTWTFVANRPDWLDDPEHWRETTRALEDKLSDALHDRLTQRFVDRRTSVLMRRLRENAAMDAEINDAGEVTIEGQPVGRMQGFQFTLQATADPEHAKAMRAAAQKALAASIQTRAEKVAEAGNDAFVLASNGAIRWIGEEIARLSPGDSELEPRVRLLADDSLSGSHRDWVQARLEAWVRHHVGTLLKPLFDLRTGTGLEGLARGIAFRLVEELGVLERVKVAEDVKNLDQAARSALRALGVRFGAYHIFVPATMKPKPRELAAQLWGLRHGGLSPEALQELPQLASAGRTSIKVDPAIPKPVYRVVGYKVLGERAVRVDILERLADIIRPLIAYRPGLTQARPPKGAAEGDGFTVTVEMTSLAGCSGEDFASILRGLGYRAETRPRAEHEAKLAAANAAADDAEARAAAERAAAEARKQAESAASMVADPPAASESSTDSAARDTDAPGSAAAESASTPADEVAAPEEPVSAEPAEVPAAQLAAIEGAAAVAGPELAPAEIGPAAEADASPEPAQSQAEIPREGPPPSETEAAATQAPEAIAGDAEPPPADAAGAEPATPAPPETVEIWRPARFERRPHDRAGQGRPDRRGPRRAPGAEAPAGAPERRGRPDRRPRPGQPGSPPPAEGAAASAEGAAVRPPRPPPREERSRQERFRTPDRPQRRPDGERPPGPGGQSDRPRGPRPDRDRERDRAPRVFSSEQSGQSRGPDPDSPFAKLAQLRAQMESDKKS